MQEQRWVCHQSEMFPQSPGVAFCAAGGGRANQEVAMKELPLPTHSSPQPTFSSTQPFPSPKSRISGIFSSRVEGGFARR